MSERDRHVVPNPGGGWDVEADNAERAISHHETQAQAIDQARESIANAGGGKLILHARTGTFRESHTVNVKGRTSDSLSEAGTDNLTKTDFSDLAGRRPTNAPSADAKTPWRRLGERLGRLWRR